MNYQYRSKVLDRLGVRSCINARNWSTDIGGCWIDDRVLASMNEVAKTFVDMHELLEKAGNKNIIGVIPVTVPFANVIHYLNQEDDIAVRRSYIYGQSLNDIQIELVDVLGNLLDLDGQNFEIIFKCISNN